MIVVILRRKMDLKRDRNLSSKQGLCEGTLRYYLSRKAYSLHENGNELLKQWINISKSAN